MRLLLGSVIAAILAIAAIAVVGLPAMYANEMSAAYSPPSMAWATSDTCAGCHPDQYASWHRTFHRTMTQQATPKSVLGRFDGETYRYWGVGVRPVRHDDRYYFQYLDDADNVTLTLPVLRTVGSRRYQQYLVQTPAGGQTYYRVHLLWHMEDQRWMHINGVFLRPDEQGFDDRVAVWNHNCIFCHNTGPQPDAQNMEELRLREMAGEPVNSALEATYNSTVAELGIACETCHGPGAIHAQRNRNPLRRYALHLGDLDDPTITHPRKVSQQQSVDLCGQCHGQRTPRSVADLMQWIETGPTFRAGERLADHVNPVFRDTPVPPGLNPDMFSQRFWNDGTARLTAYEYQGLVQSPCFDGGEITCISCHTLHAGDIHGNIPEENRGNKPCLQCHQSIADDVTAHTRHTANSSGSKCYECHMPKMVFGITDIHRSHRIEIPRPAADAANNRPNACTHCHVDMSVARAQRQVDSWWGGKTDTDTDAFIHDHPHLVESLHGGDPVQRAVAARLAGRDDTPWDHHAQKRGVLYKAFLVPHLLRAMEDHYPSTRNLARKSLLRLDRQFEDAGVITGLQPILHQYDFIAPLPQRQAWMRQLWFTWQDHYSDSRYPKPPPGSLSTGSDVVEPDTTRLVKRGHSFKNQIAIGE